jgi:hypothetical protein
VKMLDAIAGVSLALLTASGAVAGDAPTTDKKAAPAAAVPAVTAAPAPAAPAAPAAAPAPPSAPAAPAAAAPSSAPAAPASPAPAVAAAATAPLDPAALAAQRSAALRKKVLRDDDFVENDEVNRDPFHSYLRLFIDKGVVKNRKAPAVFEKLGLEELSLIAIVSGDSTPYAMFRDPAGLGETVKKGDYISKSSARVTKILSDRVVVELMETNAKGEPHPVEKAILVNPDDGAR